MTKPYPDGGDITPGGGSDEIKPTEGSGGGWVDGRGLIIEGVAAAIKITGA